MVAEVYTFDAVSQLGYLAAVTERVELMSSIFPIYSRTPALTAMTAAGLDFVSGGRFTLGLGASGPQVIEGWHGVPYDAPLQRTREAAEIAEKWEPIFFVPEKAPDVWGASLKAGTEKRDPALGELDIVTGVPVAI